MLMRKAKETKINTVEYFYSGSDKDFNSFLRFVVYDYIIGNTRDASRTDFIDNAENMPKRKVSIDFRKRL